MYGHTYSKGMGQSGDPVNDWGGGGGCNNFAPVLVGDGTKVAPTGDIYAQPLDEMS